jgi:hypothetical protein
MKGIESMKHLASALVLSLAVAQFAAMPADAAEPAAQFRTAAPQSFTADDLERYGLTASEARSAASYQDKGYRLMVLSPEEAKQYQAGVTDNQWLLIGIFAAVVVIAVAVAD